MTGNGGRKREGYVTENNCCGGDRKTCKEGKERWGIGGNDCAWSHTWLSCEDIVFTCQLEKCHSSQEGLLFRLLARCRLTMPIVLPFGWLTKHCCPAFSPLTKPLCVAIWRSFTLPSSFHFTFIWINFFLLFYFNKRILYEVLNFDISYNKWINLHKVGKPETKICFELWKTTNLNKVY